MKRTAASLITILLSALLFATTPWADVEAPVITSLESEGRELTVFFDMATGSNGADRGLVHIFEDGEEVFSRAIGRSSRSERNATFTLDHSGTYTVTVESSRRNEESVKTSESMSIDYTLPLDEPTFTLKNLGGGPIEITVNPVDEAECYIIKVYDSVSGDLVAFTGLEKAGKAVFQMTEPGEVYEFEASAIRGGEQSVSQRTRKTSRNEADREWTFTWFGQSTKEELNRMEMIDSDNLTFRLYSTKHDEAGVTTEKGGKFTSFHDGVSFYYTEIDPDTENFILTATFTIDYMNPSADGQEGFGLIAMDSLGEDGVSSVNHYTNSAGIIATKFEETIDGTKKTSKDTLGARFVTGLTEEIIQGGDSLIAEKGRLVAHAYSYDQSDLVKSGDEYTITLQKDNTGYHAIFRQEIASEDTVEEYILYGPEKLEVIDPDRSYVGFVVARGCNVTVSDVSFTVTDPETDPPALPEPDEIVPLEAKVDSPSSYFDSTYPFVFTSNADGRLTVVDRYGDIMVDNEKVKAYEDYEKDFTISTGVNDYTVTFTPDPSYRPGEKMTIGQFDDIEEKYVEDFSPVTIAHSVSFIEYDRSRLYVSSDGSIFASGTKEDPLDLDSALRYSKPGDTIVLESGVWNLSGPIMIERGNSGKEGVPKTLTCEDGRAVLNFQYAGGGMQVWGDWWTIENIDIANTPDNVKGLQIAGDYNTVRFVNAYGCGDTGIQISGTSTETWEKWPHDNLVISCMSHDNMDPAQNNADGFAAKLTVADGNTFRNCIAWSNIDDGWDLYSKIESGPIGQVTIDSCVAYSNGSLSDGSGNGDGNGFKLGGDGIAVAHRITNSIAYNNGKAGITSNSNPALIVDSVTLYGNREANLALYGKGDGERYFVATSVLSLEGGEADDVSEMSSLANESNYLFNGAESMTSEGAKATADIFKSTDMSLQPELGKDGSIDMHGLFEITEPDMTAGARI